MFGIHTPPLLLLLLPLLERWGRGVSWVYVDSLNYTPAAAAPASNVQLIDVTLFYRSPVPAFVVVVVNINNNNAFSCILLFTSQPERTTVFLLSCEFLTVSVADDGYR